jgi:hypothetical protein
MRSTLKELSRALKGLVVMSSELEKMCAAGTGTGAAGLLLVACRQRSAMRASSRFFAAGVTIKALSQR